MTQPTPYTLELKAMQPGEAKDFQVEHIHNFRVKVHQIFGKGNYSVKKVEGGYRVTRA